jgi:hypothetical protein
MLNLCGIVTAILKMATGRKFSMSGINSGHHYPGADPGFQVRAIFKMAATKTHKFTIVRFQRISKVAFDLFFKPVVSGRFGRLCFYSQHT